MMPFKITGKRRKSADPLDDLAGRKSEDLFTDLEITRLRVTFELHVSKDEVIATKDVPKAMKALGIIMTDTATFAVVSRMDPQRSGVVDFNRFFLVMARLLKPQWKTSSLEAAFNALVGEVGQGHHMTVKHAHGLETKEEHRRKGVQEIDGEKMFDIMGRLGVNDIKIEDCVAMIKEVDRTGNGTMTRKDFYTAMRKYD